MFGKNVTNPMLRNSSDDRYQKKKQDELIDRKSKRVKLNPPPDTDIGPQLNLPGPDPVRPPEARLLESMLLFTQDVDYSSPGRVFFPSKSSVLLQNEQKPVAGAKQKPVFGKPPDIKDKDSKQHLKQKVIDMVNRLFLEG